MNTQQFLARLMVLLEDEHDVDRVDTFEDLGVLTNDDGLIVVMGNGDEFDITITGGAE